MYLILTKSPFLLQKATTKVTFNGMIKLMCVSNDEDRI